MAVQHPRDILARDLADVARHAPGRLSVVVRDPSGVVAELDGARVAPGASLVKLLVLAALLDDVERGIRDLADVVELDPHRVGGSGALALLPGIERLSLDDLARLMICQSDNDASNALLDVLGPDAIERTRRDFGLDDTRIARRFMDADARARGIENTTSAADIALLLARLRSGDVLPYRQVEHAFGLLAAQQHAIGLTALLPDGVRHASKPGSLRGLRHDCAVIETHDGAWAAVAVLGTDMEDTRYGQDYSVSVLPAYNAIGEAVLAYLTPVVE